MRGGACGQYSADNHVRGNAYENLNVTNAAITIYIIFTNLKTVDIFDIYRRFSTLIGRNALCRARAHFIDKPMLWIHN